MFLMYLQVPSSPKADCRVLQGADNMTNVIGSNKDEMNKISVDILEEEKSIENQIDEGILEIEQTENRNINDSDGDSIFGTDPLLIVSAATTTTSPINSQGVSRAKIVKEVEVSTKPKTNGPVTDTDVPYVENIQTNKLLRSNKDVEMSTGLSMSLSLSSYQQQSRDDLFEDETNENDKNEQFKSDISKRSESVVDKIDEISNRCDEGSSIQTNQQSSQLIPILQPNQPMQMQTTSTTRFYT